MLHFHFHFFDAVVFLITSTLNKQHWFSGLSLELALQYLLGYILKQYWIIVSHRPF